MSRPCTLESQTGPRFLPDRGTLRTVVRATFRACRLLLPRKKHLPALLQYGPYRWGSTGCLLRCLGDCLGDTMRHCVEDKRRGSRTKVRRLRPSRRAPAAPARSGMRFANALSGAGGAEGGPRAPSATTSSRSPRDAVSRSAEINGTGASDESAASSLQPRRSASFARQPRSRRA